MIHWCPDETLAVVSSLPLIGIAWRWLRSRFTKKP